MTQKSDKPNGQGQTDQKKASYLRKVTATKGRDGAIRVEFSSGDGEPFSQRDVNLIEKAIRVEYKKYRATQIVRHRGKKEQSNGEAVGKSK